MANLQQYTQGIPYVDGAALTEATSVRVRRATNSQPVNTIAKGYAGESPGAGMIEIDVENAVPSLAFELNPGKFMKNLATCEFTLFAGNATLTVKGFIVEDSFQAGVNAASGLSFTFRAPFEDWT